MNMNMNTMSAAAAVSAAAEVAREATRLRAQLSQSEAINAAG